MTESEIWKDVVGFENRYQVSNLGNVKSLDRLKKHNTSKTGYISVKGKVLKPYSTPKGYLQVDLGSLDGKRHSKKVHRLVAKAFISNSENYEQVNHIDGDKANNVVDNLEWCNNSMNQIHAYKTGLNVSSDWAGRPKKSVLKIDKDTNKVIKKYSSISDAARRNGINKASNISMACQGKRNTCGGYRWAYANEREVMPNDVK